MTSRILLYSTMNWPSVARYAGGFRAAGHEVHVACPKGAVATVSRYVSEAHRYRPLAPVASLRCAIAAARPEVVVPCDDRAVAHLLALGFENDGGSSQMGRLIARSLGDPGKYARVLSRSGSLNELKTLGVRIPDTLPVGSEAELDDRAARVGLPAVLKSDGSWGGDGVVVARTREQLVAGYRKLARPPSRLRSVLRAVKRKDLHFLLGALKPERRAVSIQKFVAGRPAASAFAAQDGRILAAFHYDVLVAEGAIGPPSVIRRVNDAEMDRAVETVARCFGLSGLHGIDFIRDADGRVHLIEINPRATQGGTLSFGAGRDLCAALAQTLSPTPVDARPSIPNDIVAFYPREIRRDPASPYLLHGYNDVPHDDPAVRDAIAGKRPETRKVLGTVLSRLRARSRAARPLEIS